MRRAGYVLVGGRSRRMGRDKALLPYRGMTLVEHIAGQVRAAAGSVALVGPPEKYRHLGLPVIADQRHGCGPLGGLHTILGATGAEWNLVVACDMPGLTAEFLEELLERAESMRVRCLAPRSPGGQAEPLCAVYHRTALAIVEGALEAGVRKLTEVLDLLEAAYIPRGEPGWFRNANTPQEWIIHG